MTAFPKMINFIKSSYYLVWYLLTKKGQRLPGCTCKYFSTQHYKG